MRTLFAHVSAYDHMKVTECDRPRKLGAIDDVSREYEIERLSAAGRDNLCHSGPSRILKSQQTENELSGGTGNRDARVNQPYQTMVTSASQECFSHLECQVSYQVYWAVKLILYEQLRQATIS